MICHLHPGKHFHLQASSYSWMLVARLCHHMAELFQSTARKAIFLFSSLPLFKGISSSVPLLKSTNFLLSTWYKDNTIPHTSRQLEQTGLEYRMYLITQRCKLLIKYTFWIWFSRRKKLSLNPILCVSFFVLPRWPLWEACPYRSAPDKWTQKVNYTFKWKHTWMFSHTNRFFRTIVSIITLQMLDICGMPNHASNLPLVRYLLTGHSYTSCASCEESMARKFCREYSQFSNFQLLFLPH